MDADEEEEGEAEMTTRVEAAQGAEREASEAGKKRERWWAELKERRRRRLERDSAGRGPGASRAERGRRRIRVEEDTQDEGGG